MSAAVVYHRRKRFVVYGRAHFGGQDIIRGTYRILDIVVHGVYVKRYVVTFLAYVVAIAVIRERSSYLVAREHTFEFVFDALVVAVEVHVGIGNEGYGKFYFTYRIIDRGRTEYHFIIAPRVEIAEFDVVFARVRRKHTERTAPDVTAYQLGRRYGILCVVQGGGPRYLAGRIDLVFRFGGSHFQGYVLSVKHSGYDALGKIGEESFACEARRHGVEIDVIAYVKQIVYVHVLIFGDSHFRFADYHAVELVNAVAAVFDFVE